MSEILVTRSSMPPLEEYVEEIKSIWDSHWMTNMGPKHKEFQRKLEKYLGVPHVELLVNGHMALEMTLQAMQLEGEVITTPFTFASTTHAIVRNGLTPVFCDIHPDTCTIDETKIEALITEKTCAIMPVHVYGNICNVEEIDRVAKKYNLKVIYDAAHAFGETYKGISVGNFGDASIFSFHATKVFNSIEGGAVCYKDPELGARLYDLKNFGIHGPEVVSAVGANAKMNEFAAAMGICNLRHVDEEIGKRKMVYEKYVELLKDVKGIHIVDSSDCTTKNYAYFPILIEDTYKMTRDELYIFLKGRGIFTRKYFSPISSEFDCYKDSFDSSNTPYARELSAKVLALPMYADLGEDSINAIVDCIKDVE